MVSDGSESVLVGDVADLVEASVGREEGVGPGDLGHLLVAAEERAPGLLAVRVALGKPAKNNILSYVRFFSTQRNLLKARHWQ